MKNEIDKVIKELLYENKNRDWYLSILGTISPEDFYKTKE